MWLVKFAAVLSGEIPEHTGWLGRWCIGCRWTFISAHLLQPSWISTSSLWTPACNSLPHFPLCIDKGEPHTQVRKKCSLYCFKCIKCCSIIGVFGEIIFTIIGLYWVVIKTSPHKRKCWDLSTSMPKPQRAYSSEDRTGRLWRRGRWNLKKCSL